MTRLFTVLCLLPLTAVAAPAPKEKAGQYYHPTREGDTQVYESKIAAATTEYTIVVKKVESADGVLRVTTERAVPSGKNLANTVEVSAAGVFRRSAVKDKELVPVLKLPAKVGESWSPPLPSESAARARGATITYTVAAVDEEVEVPAGKFKAIRVDEVIAVRDQSLKSSVWYAPGVGMVKTVQATPVSDRVVVLKSFTPGK